MARRTRRTVPAAAAAPPAGDVRLMNGVAAAVVALAVLGLLAAGVLWLTRAAMFTIRGIQIEGELAHSNVPTIRANALPYVQGNFFSVDLARVRAAFEQVPWVRRAVVRRVWPDRLVVRLEEHRAAALWEGSGGVERLVNSFGEVFQANLGDVEDDDLPVFAGPEGRAAQVLALWQRLQPAFAERGFVVERLALSGRGSWRAELDNGAVVEIGRGEPDEIVARTARFLRTVPDVAARWRRPLEYADLRHVGGYALRLRDVGTAPAPTN